MNRSLSFYIAFGLLLSIPSAASAQQKRLPLPGEVFRVQGHTAFLIQPEKKGAAPTPWVLYAPTLPRLPGKHERWMFERFLKRGIAIAGIDVGESYGSPAGRKLYTALYEELVTNRGLAQQACLLARSRGGLMLYNWASDNPRRVACIAGIYPVCNLKSYPGLSRASGAYGLDAAGLRAQLDRHNPIARLAPLARSGVPIFHIHGDSDHVVPLDQNSQIVARRYKKLGGKMTLATIKGHGHDLWKGWFEDQRLVDFIVRHATGARGLPPGVDAAEWREAERQIDGFRLAKKNLDVRLFANSNQLIDPTAICFDDQNRLYVCESYRWRRGGVDDNRQRQFWFLDDIACQTTADRLNVIKKWVSKYPLSHYTKYSERVLRLVDSDGDGRADRRTVFAEGFNAPLDGPAIGLIAREGKVWLTCIPHLWELQDTDGDGKADKRRSVQDGFGVRVSLSGHDMHGLVWGPDGKLYWSIGDRGYNITTKEGRHFKAPASGAVFRCNPDGSDLEVFYEGLRNPQELAFDQFGNLFTVDNNADLGDKARVVYLLEGGNAGWQSGYQNLTTFRRASGIDGGNLVAWMEERIWGTEQPGRPAYVLPPAKGFTIKGQVRVSGPSGVVFHSTPVLGDDLQNAFYVCDFRGRASRSAIYSFKVEGDGAGFKVTDHKEFLGGVGTPDIDFSYDGKLYIADWYGAWTGNDKGNVYTVSDPQRAAASYVRETQQVFAAGFAKQSTQRLGRLLAHVDLRVRLRAQFELANRGDAGHTVLLQTAQKHDSLVARLHGIWGCGQQHRVARLIPLLEDTEVEVRANTLRVLGDNKHDAALEQITALLEDESPRVRSLAATALGTIGAEDSLEPLLVAILANGDEDAFLRHACAHAIARIHDGEFVYSNLKHEDKAVRLAMLLVLRRWRDPKLGEMLEDTDPFLVEEAARAIYDLGLDAAMPALAASLGDLTEQHSIMTHLRAAHANFRQGSTADARRLFDWCHRRLPKLDKVRIEAMHLFKVWAKPPKVDRVVGPIRAYTAPRAAITAVVRAELPKILLHAKGTVAAKAIDLATQYDVQLDAEVLVGIARNTGQKTDFRVSSIRKLLEQDPMKLAPHVAALLRDRQPAVRDAALGASLQLDATDGFAKLLAFLDGADPRNRQIAYAHIPDADHEKITERLVTRLELLRQRKGMKETRLELLEVAARSTDQAVAALLAEHEAATKSPFLSHAVALYGGDKERGRDLFQNHGIAQCVRCHNLDGRASTGPGLRGVGKKGREYLLRSLLTPSAEIAEGFGTIMVETKAGEEFVGVQTKADETTITLKLEKKTVRIKKADIVSQSKPVSAMVPMLGILKKRELRDLLEFLSSLK